MLAVPKSECRLTRQATLAACVLGQPAKIFLDLNQRPLPASLLRERFPAKWNQYVTAFDKVKALGDSPHAEKLIEIVTRPFSYGFADALSNPMCAGSLSASSTDIVYKLPSPNDRKWSGDCMCNSALVYHSLPAELKRRAYIENIGFRFPSGVGMNHLQCRVPGVIQSQDIVIDHCDFFATLNNKYVHSRKREEIINGKHYGVPPFLAFATPRYLLSSVDGDPKYVTSIALHKRAEGLALTVVTFEQSQEGEVAAAYQRKILFTHAFIESNRGSILTIDSVLPTFGEEARVTQINPSKGIVPYPNARVRLDQAEAVRLILLPFLRTPVASVETLLGDFWPTLLPKEKR